MEGSVLEAVLGTERADALVSMVADDLIRYVDRHYGTEDDLEVFDDAIDQCVGENQIVQLVQMSDDDAVSELGMRIAVELEVIARTTEDAEASADVQTARKLFSRHFAEWLMSTSPEEYESEPEVE